LVLLTGAWVRAQDSYNDRAQKYIEKYGPLAIEEQRRSGIPACITLGQGILETEAGASELMTQANNHFGIKCHNDWQGDKFLHTDDAPMECFKKYKCAEDSYKDHSDYLKRNPRYTPLFKLKQTDYKSWAVCLRKCGYATNPQYAQNLIKIIENFKLQDYTYSALDSSLVRDHSAAPVVAETNDLSTIASTPDSARNFITRKEVAAPPAAAPVVVDSTKIVTVNDMKAFYARKGEMLTQYAARYKVSYSRLLEMNDLPNGPLPFNTCVYLEKKQTLGTRPTHTVKEGESLLFISQVEGVQLKKLMAMNMLNPNEEPVTGSVIYLQSATAVKPEVKINAGIAHNTDAIITGPESTPKQDNDYIPTSKIKPAVAAVVPSPAVPPPSRVVIDTPVVHKAAPVVVNVPKPEPRVDTPKHHVVPPAHVIVVKEADETPKPKPPPVFVHTYVPEKPVVTATPPTAKLDPETEAEFTKLKAELDKVVYADDSKLVAKIESEKPQQKTEETLVPKNAKYYVVKKGDTAFSIAKKNNITVNELLKLNEITASGVKAGKNLRVK